MNQISTDRFTPIRGTEAQILASDPVRGYLWFAIDTKKIYYSDGLNFISMGGNSSIYYGNMIFSETPDDDQTEFNFNFLEIDGNTEDEIKNIPNLNDLILNIPDGCFYRVIEVNSDFIIAKKLTIAGSGSGGTGQTTENGNYTYSRIGNPNITALYKDSCIIKFKFIATDKDGESTGDAKAALFVKGIKVKEFRVKQGENELDIGEYLTEPSDEIRVRLGLTFNTGGADKTEYKEWKVNVLSIDLNWNYRETNINTLTSPFLFIWNVTGKVQKTTHIKIDDIYEINIGPNDKITEQQYEIRPENLSDFGLTHGAHKVEMYVTANINDNIIKTNSIFKYLIFVDESLENPAPIIACNFIEKNLVQYNTVQIPIIIFKKTSQGTVSVILRENGEEKDRWDNVQNATLYNWSYTPVTSGEQVLTIVCENSEFRLVLNVDPLNLDNEEIGGYAFRFKATDFASNNAVKNWNSNGITLETSENFDWEHGGLKQESDENNQIRQYVCIKAGTTLTIDYDLFKTNPFNNGKNIKLIFKATNCRDYDAQVLKSYDDNNNTGLLVRAQNAILQTNLRTLTTQYCEDTYIEFETEIWPSEDKWSPNRTDISQRYIIGWLDGVPSGAVVYSTEDRIIRTANSNSKIVIGSDQCDVYLYMLKVYERHLTDENHLTNFIADAPNASEMLARFRRNDILDDYGNISYLKLATANPNCRIHLFDIPRITQSKDDKVGDSENENEKCTYTQYHGSNEAVLSANDVVIAVQGTSSAAYGLSAFNLDADFSKSGFIDANGETIEKWPMDDNAIPIDYFNFKVNVASAEGANNALNQEWYNRYQPYKCDWRIKNPQARDTMQFYPGVLFIKDRNPVTDSNDTGDNLFKEIPDYINNPEFRLYAICNMGNSKKNTAVFHDKTNPNEVCIEVTDNQTAGQWMTIPQGYYKDSSNIPKPRTLESIDNEKDYADWVMAMDDNAYDFRYPKMKNVSAEKGEEIRRAWFRLVKWMSSCDPSPKYQKLGKISQEDFIYYTTDHYEGEGENKILIEGVELYIINEEQRHVIFNEYDSNAEYYLASTAHPYGYTDEPLDTPYTVPFYTFGREEWSNKKYVETVLDGLEIKDYAGTYTTDCYEYRMAKMLKECEQYLIMDAVVFHYIFIERHTMIDNVAKNTFWTTEDLIHWAPIKDYDNDTADGNDNSGNLVLTYGLEALDQKDGVYVFNAHDSVWFNFIHGLKPACEEMYRNRSAAGAWNVNNYLTAFEEWQNSIPERCWIEDYHRKYLRPREVYGTNFFISKMEGGKKTHQRKQFEKYQDVYMDTKYWTGISAISDKSRAMSFRANAQGMTQDYPLPITTYQDCYVNSNVGGQLTSQRAKRNTPVYILFDREVLGNMNDATGDIYAANLYTSIGDLSYIKPKSIDVSNATRLQELIVGEREINDSLLQSISLGSNIMLEKIIAKNCTNVATTGAHLNLDSIIGLKELDLRNSNFTGVQIAKNAPLKKLYLENPSSIRASDLTQLEDFDITSYSNITKLNLDNVDNNSFKLNNKSLSQILTEEALKNRLEDYNLYNVNWKIFNDDNDFIDDITNEQIILLEQLLTKFPTNEKGDSISSAEALSGNLIIMADAYNENNSFNIYDKYAKSSVYPNLDINFEGDNAKLYSITVLNGNDEVYWHRNIKPNEQIDIEFLSDGPNGAYDSEGMKKSKSETEAHTFDFSYSWEVYDDNGEFINSVDNELPLYPSVNTNLIFKPNFAQRTRTYEVKFWNRVFDNSFAGYSDTLLNPTSYVFDYGTVLRDALPKVLPFKDDSDLDFEETNGFIGYSFSPESKILVSDDFIITDNYNFYTQFEIKSVYDNVLNSNYYSIVDRGTEGVWISKKENIVYNGKITLPIVHTDGRPIIGVANFSNTTMTHVFWEKKENILNQVSYIGSNAFERCSNLFYFEMPELVEKINDNAFNQCSNLFVESSEKQIEDFFKNITSIGTNAFQRTGLNGGIGLNTILKLPGTLITLGQQAFSRSGYHRIQIGGYKDPSQLNENTCGSNIFFVRDIAIETLLISVENQGDARWQPNSTLRNYLSIDSNHIEFKNSDEEEGWL